MDVQAVPNIPGDDVAFLRATVPDYAGYDDEASRTATDQRIRAFIGSRLARLAERLRGTLDAGTTERLDALILRCEFPDQRRIHALAHARLDTTEQARELAEDRRLVTLAEAAWDASLVTLGRTIAQIDADFDARSTRAYEREFGAP